MVAVTWWTLSWTRSWARDLLLVYPIVIGAAVYIGCLFVLRAIPAVDLALLRQIIQGLRARLGRHNTQPA